MKKPELIFMIEKIITHFVKFNYHEYLKQNKLSKLNDNELNTFIHTTYDQKKNNLSKYIRDCLKESLGDNYPPLIVNSIILEIFDDDDLAKNKVIIEIQNYQESMDVDTLIYNLD